MSDQIETLLKQQGEAFEAFKASHDERLGKIEKSLDTAIEAKTAIEAAVKAEKAEREALERE